MAIGDQCTAMLVLEGMNVLCWRAEHHAEKHRAKVRGWAGERHGREVEIVIEWD